MSAALGKWNKCNGKSIQNRRKASVAVWGRDMVKNEKPRKKTGCARDGDAAMDVWSLEE